MSNNVDILVLKFSIHPILWITKYIKFMDVAKAGPPSSLEGRRADALCSALSVVLTTKLWPMESVGIVFDGREAIISKIVENYL